MAVVKLSIHAWASGARTADASAFELLGVVCFWTRSRVGCGQTAFSAPVFRERNRRGIVPGKRLGIVQWPQYFGGSTVGASAGVMGVIAAFAMLFPDQQLVLLLFYVIPIKLRAKTLLWFYLRG